MSTIKVTNITPQSGTTVHLTGSLTISETLTAKEVRTSINSSEILVSGSTKFGDTADDTHQFTGSLLVNGNTTHKGTIDATGATSKVRFLYATTGDLPAAATYHGMFAHVHAEGAAYYAHAGNWVELGNSSSLATDIATNVTNISSNDTDIASLGTASGSFSTRVTTEEANVDALQTDSGSFSTRVTTEETNVDALQVDSGSFSTRVTTNETNITTLQSFSSSLDATYATDTQLSNASASLANAIATNLTTLGNLDSTYATDAQLNSVSASVKTFATNADTTLSSSIATDIASNASDIVTINATNATTGTNTFTGNQIISSSVLVTLQPIASAPASAATGSLIVSGSPSQLYIYNGSGSGWNRV